MSRLTLRWSQRRLFSRLSALLKLSLANCLAVAQLEEVRHHAAPRIINEECSGY
jgi:hypothetical protein